MAPYKPQRGEVYKANLNPPEGTDPGREYAGDWKTVLVIQHDKLNRNYSTVIVVPLTTTLKHARLPSTVELARIPGGILTEPCVALCHQLRVLDTGKLRQFCGKLSASDMARVSEMVSHVLALSPPPLKGES